MGIYIFRGGRFNGCPYFNWIGDCTLEEICKREVIDKMRWRDPNPGRDGRSVEHGKEIKRDFMSRPELRNREAEKWFRRKPYGKE